MPLTRCATAAAPPSDGAPLLDTNALLLGGLVPQPLTSEPDDGAPRGMWRNPPNREGGGAAADAGVPDRPPFKAFLRNLAFSATKDDIGKFFHANEVSVTDVRVLTNSDGRASGNAMATMADRRSLVKALELGGMDLCGRRFEIRVDLKAGGGGGGGSFRNNGSGGSGSRDRDEGMRGGGRGGGSGFGGGGSGGGATEFGSSFQRAGASSGGGPTRRCVRFTLVADSSLCHPILGLGLGHIAEIRRMLSISHSLSRLQARHQPAADERRATLSDIGRKWSRRRAFRKRGPQSSVRNLVWKRRR